MPPKFDGKTSVIIAPSNVSHAEDKEGAEETEIAATILLTGDDWWGWVVVASSFTIIAILDGVAFTFGSILGDMSDDLQIDSSLVALLNSIAASIYMMAGPLASALINRYGFRAICMAGSVICGFSLCLSSLVSNYAVLVLVYGLSAGFGFSLINLSAGLVVGFYFEKLRAIAIAVSTSGSSIGVMVFYPLNSYLSKLAGWRSTMLFHSGLFGMVYFFAMAYRPLLAFNITKTTTTNDPTKTVTFLPNLSTPNIKPAPGQRKDSEELQSTGAERLFQAVQNTNYPTAAAVVEEAEAAPAGQPTTSGQAARSDAGVSKLTITAVSTKGVTQKQLNHVKSMMSKGRIGDQTPSNVEINITPKVEKKPGCCGGCCHWDEHVTESRPMYRDDAFYTGQVEKLQEYQKSRAAIDSGKEKETGFEYQLAVSRAAAASDLAERRGVFTTAVRRVLATMLDLNLLRRKSYLAICLSGVCVYLGYLVPFVFIQTRNLANGIDPVHCDLFVSVIGGSNAVGRITLGALAVKVDPLKICAFTICIAGISTIISSVSYNVYFQYGYCVIFGYCVSSLVCLRSILLVAFYGLDRLTNATGMLILIQSFGCLASTPLSSVLQANFGYFSAFAVAGSFIVLGGLFMMTVKTLIAREDIDSAPRSGNTAPTPKDEPKEPRERRMSVPIVVQKPIAPPPPPPPPPSRQVNPFRRKEQQTPQPTDMRLGEAFFFCRKPAMATRLGKYNISHPLDNTVA